MYYYYYYYLIKIIFANFFLSKNCYAIALLYNVTSDELYNDTSRYVESYYSITCCRNGFPVPDPSLAPQIKEWTQQLTGPVEYGGNTTCNRYIGRYSLPYGWTTNNKDVTVGVRCQCPEERLDRNCRYLPECQNSGYRSFSINLRCVCPGQYFGELCEKYCLNGNLVKNSQLIDECQCQPNFYGDECQRVTCFNGGTPVSGRGCSCPIPFFGLHCEARLNGTLDSSVLNRQDALHRNLSGTAISLFLVLSLTLVSIYLIKRRRRLRQAIIAANNAAAMREHPAIICAQNPDSAVAAAYHRNAVVAGGFDASHFPPLPAYSDVVKSAPPAYYSNNSTDADLRRNDANTVQRNPIEGSNVNNLH